MSMSCTTGQLHTITSAGRQASDKSDVALIRSIAEGNKHAMQNLFARHNVRVFRFVLRFVGDKSAAEDLVSEAFLDFGVRPEDFRADLRLQPGFWRLPATRRFRRCGAGRPKNWMKMPPQPSRTHRTTPR